MKTKLRRISIFQHHHCCCWQWWWWWWSMVVLRPVWIVSPYHAAVTGQSCGCSISHDMVCRTNISYCITFNFDSGIIERLRSHITYSRSSLMNQLFSHSARPSRPKSQLACVCVFAVDDVCLFFGATFHRRQQQFWIFDVVLNSLNANYNVWFVVHFKAQRFCSVDLFMAIGSFCKCTPSVDILNYYFIFHTFTTGTKHTQLWNHLLIPCKHHFPFRFFPVHYAIPFANAIAIVGI